MEPGAASRVAHGQVFSWQLLREPAVSLICLDVPCSECRQNKRQGRRVLRMLTSFFDSAARVCRTKADGSQLPQPAKSRFRAAAFGTFIAYS